METNGTTTNGKTDPAKETKPAWWGEFIEKLKNTPEEKLTPIAKMWIENYGKESEWEVCDPSILYG